MGGILFWVDSNVLREIVVMDPFEAFVKPIRTIICDTQIHTKGEPHESCKSRWRKLYDEYENYGRLDALNLLPALLMQWISNQAVIIKLMCDFGLMVLLPE